MIGFTTEKGGAARKSLHLVKRGAEWKLNIQYMLHLSQKGLTHKLIRHRIANELTFAHLLRSIKADLISGKIKTWRQFTVDFESRVLAVTARKEAEKEAKHKVPH